MAQLELNQDLRSVLFDKIELSRFDLIALQCEITYANIDNWARVHLRTLPHNFVQVLIVCSQKSPEGALNAGASGITLALQVGA